MNELYLITLLQARLLVGFLGEKAKFAWWPTAYFEQSSSPFLEPVFPKTSSLAQYHGVSEAARRLHDEHLSAGSYHLFRLPEEVEQDLHAMVKSGSGEDLVSHTKEAALGALKRMGGAKIPSYVGPTAVGSIKDLASVEISRAISEVYFSAFSHNTKAYPYLVRQR